MKVTTRNKNGTEFIVDAVECEPSGQKDIILKDKIGVDVTMSFNCKEERDEYLTKMTNAIIKELKDDIKV